MCYPAGCKGANCLYPRHGYEVYIFAVLFFISILSGAEMRLNDPTTVYTVVNVYMYICMFCGFMKTFL